jgi:hypothetical protein
MEALDGKGEVAAKRQISSKELADYAIKHFDQLAKALNGEQEPQYFKGRDSGGLRVGTLVSGGDASHNHRANAPDE